MSYKHIFLIALFSPFLFLFGQENNSAEEQYIEYFDLPRETLFLHLNKTTYLKGEEIWFKGYIYDRKNDNVSTTTSNINIEIFDAFGKPIKKELSLAYNGTTNGNILIDSTFTTGDYFIKASTNWMKNFKEDDSYIQKIKIIAPNEATIAKKKHTPQYDFQFLPEGGHIVANIKNTIGFKCINENGYGTEVSVSLLDENKQQVATFKSNALGLGKFVFIPKAQQKYTAEITTPSGEKIVKPLEIAKSKGITMMLNLIGENVIAVFKTNDNTLSEIKDEQFKILIHKDGQLKTIAFSFGNDKNVGITIPKKQLYTGVNTLTLFNDKNQPILERLFFNDANIKTNSVAVSLSNKKNDSISLAIKAAEKNYNLSVSILPENTISYSPSHSILSAFYLKPYVKGLIENPNYYFSHTNDKKKQELDLLLLTQGWSKYQWNDIFKNTPKASYDFENGIKIIGTVNYPVKNIDSLYLYPSKYHSSRVIKLDKNKKFTLTNFHTEKGEELKFSYFSKKGKLFKPKLYLAYNTTTKLQELQSSLLKNYFFESRDLVEPSKETIPDNFLLPNDRELLDEVTLIGDKKKRKRKKPPLILHADRSGYVTEKDAIRYQFAVDYIEPFGYFTSNYYGEVVIQSTRDRKVPVVFVDNVRLLDFNFLAILKTSDIESIYVNRTGLGYGLNGGTSVIKIFTRKTSLINHTNSREVLYAHKMNAGYKKAKEFYAPRYISYYTDAFEKYGIIHWEPHAYVVKNEATILKMINTKSKTVKVFIEGIAEDGSLISETKLVTIQ